MARVPMWVFLVSCLFLLTITKTSSSVEEDVKTTMISFLEKLSSSNGQQGVSVQTWNKGSDPCKDQWQGVVCDSRNLSVTRLFLDRFGFFGTLDVTMLCNSQPLAASLSILSISGNNLSGGVAPEISKCKQLTRLIVSGNKLSGNLPTSLAMLGNLKRLDLSSNEFSGEFPDLSSISGLNVLYAQNNHFNGSIPLFDFSNLYRFNVSFNNFSGRIPDVQGYFSQDSFLGNPELCGKPLTRNCSSQSIKDDNSEVSNPPKGASKDQILMYSGYAALGLVIILIVVYKLCTRKKGSTEGVNKVAASGDHGSGSIEKTSISNASSGNKSGTSRSELNSMASESGLVSQSLIVLTQPAEVNELRLEDLLRAPAELLGRGKYGSLYKVMLDSGKTVVVKRIKDLATSSLDFKRKMETLGRRKHPFVLSPLAFYSSRQEKLLVYEFQENGSLFKLLHGESRKGFDWSSRLAIASTISEGLAFMHQELRDEGIAHGNLKSSNILLSHTMEARISEYGVMAAAMDDQQSSSSFAASPHDPRNNALFKADVYGFGVILLELLTGKLVKSDGVDLTEWVKSVVREEWTGEVFDRCLIAEYASEERMVNLLQVAIKCVHRSPEARPSMNQVALMISTIKEEEEKSLIYEV
ncbi:putative inactive receptor kinase [Senna tora]|uniref:Putative inactive receptor kinase n=1 Tax=Senna tora TaxID=362788 RepID=A0A834TEK7_9FABA|nr:putative inactive receptor kinase [Senna tora]